MEQENQSENPFSQTNQPSSEQSSQADQFEQLAQSVQSAQNQAGSPSATQPSLKYAGFWVRFVAAMADGLIVGIVNWGLTFAIFYASPDLIENTVFRFLNMFIMWTYAIVMLNKYQATVGKRVMGLKVVSDTSETLTLKQIILRETVGKLLSAITLGIGYVMAGFTERKQALHDKVAGTLVVYKDPNAKTSISVIVGVVIVGVIALVVGVGLVSSVVLSSLSSAREKAQDASMKATLMSAIPDALLYQDKNGTLLGFQPIITEGYPECSGKPIVNISSDGSNMAIFGKLCDRKDQYYCADIASVSGEVDMAYAQSGAFTCPESLRLNQKDSSQATSIDEAIIVDKLKRAKALDENIDSDIRMASADIEAYKIKNGSYKGYVLDASGAKGFDIFIEDTRCNSQMRVDISPLGDSYIVYEPLCTDRNQVSCMENGMAQPVVALGELASKTYRCK